MEDVGGGFGGIVIDSVEVCLYPLGAGHSFQYCPYAIVHLIQKRKHDDPYYISVNRVLATCVTYLLIYVCMCRIQLLGPG